MDLIRLNPFHRPCWPWEFVGDLCANKQRPRAGEVARIGEAFRYRRNLDAADTEPLREKVRRRHPGLAAAHRVFDQGGVRRDEMEARLLAYEDHENVARKTGVDTHTVTAYSRYFFAIPPDGLGAGYIADQVIGFAGSLHDVPEGQIWRCAGYYGGHDVLDILVDDFHARPCDNPADRKTLAERARFAIRSGLSVHHVLIPDAEWFNEFERLFGHLLVMPSPGTENVRLSVQLDILRIGAGLPPRVPHPSDATGTSQRTTAPTASTAQSTSHPHPSSLQQSLAAIGASKPNHTVAAT